MAVFATKNIVIFEAAIMMDIFATINIELGIIMTPILKSYNQTITYGYLSAAIASAVMLIIGAVFLLLLLSLSEFVKSNAGETSYFQTLFVLFKKANFFSYQIEMVIWGIGGLMFCYLLHISKLVPQWLSVLVLIGYNIVICGAIFALFGVNIDVILDIPCGLFEIFLSFWLIIKGYKFSSEKVKQ